MAPTSGEANKPGTSCLCCRRRKLKCTRESTGCENCRKAELPCIYPAPDNVKKKRGPYRKKDKPAREAHLEHVVKYLSDPLASSRNESDTIRSESPTRTFDREQDALRELAAREPERASEDLVKDALIALSQTNVTEQVLNDVAKPSSDYSYTGIRHPRAQRLLELWHLYTTRVDAMTKLLHVPTFAPQLYALIGTTTTGSRGALAVAVYFAAVSTCTAEECQRRFGESKTTMLKEYRRMLEEEVVRSHSMPDLESMQALVLFLLCLCREDSGADTWALFSLTVRNAQLLGLHVDPVAFEPYEAELRRRIWWTICSLESSCAEEGLNKTRSLFNANNVRLPRNLEDEDLRPGVSEVPEGRKGITSMSFVLMRFDVMSSNVKMWSISKQHADLAKPERKERLKSEFEALSAHLDKAYLQYCHVSRPYDWLIKTVADIMMIKCSLTIQHPGDKLLDETVPPEQRLEVLRLSVMIIRTGQRLMTSPKTPEHFWFFRSYLQWHSLAIIIAEISHNDNPHFVQTAWKVLEPFLDIWEKVYKNKTQDRTWNYVNMLIEKAKTTVSRRQSLAIPVTGKHADCTAGLLPFNAYESPESLDADLTFSDIDMTMPLDVDFDALNAVFTNVDWNEAMRTDYD